MVLFGKNEYYSKVEVEELVTRLVSDMEEKHNKQFINMVADFNNAILSCFDSAVNHEYQEEVMGRSMRYSGPRFTTKVKDLIEGKFNIVANESRIKTQIEHSKVYEDMVKNTIAKHDFIKSVVTEINARQVKGD